MNLDLFQHLTLPILLPNPKEDVKIETRRGQRPSKHTYCEKEDMSKSLVLWFGMWEKIWQRLGIETTFVARAEQNSSLKKLESSRQLQQIFAVGYLSLQANQFEPARILRPQNKRNSGKMEITNSPQKSSQGDRFGIWNLFWSINQTERGSILGSKDNKNKGKVENKCQQDRSPWKVFLWINQTETASIPRLVNKSNSGKMANKKPQKEKSLQDRFAIWELFQQTNQVETASITEPNGRLGVWELFWRMNRSEIARISKQEKSSSGKIEKNKPLQDSSPQDRFAFWELFQQRNQTETTSNPKTNAYNRKIEGRKSLQVMSLQDGLGVWELFGRVNHTEITRIHKQEKNNSNGKIEKIKLLQDRSSQDNFGVWKVFWRKNQIEAASISGLEKNSNKKIENHESPLDRFGIWGRVQQMNLPWNPFKNAETEEFEIVGSGCVIPKFKPYMAKIPWHTGPRAFLSQMFPRYGNYCGPNWSSGKQGGALIWDKKPIDWLDYCCYCHDVGYDTHDQAEMLKADLAFLECLEKNQTMNNGNSHIAEAYRLMCIKGLKTMLIPYRKQLLKQMHVKGILASKISGFNKKRYYATSLSTANGATP